jgi:hypothetical protein
MKRAYTMIAAATLGVLTLAWRAAAQQPSAPTETKVQRTDRNFIVKAAACTPALSIRI